MRLDDILQAESGHEKIMGDIIRVLSLCMGALWIGELYMEVKAFYRSLEEEPPGDESIDNALHRLEDLEIVALTPGIRATESPMGEESILVKLLRYNDVAMRLSSDPRLAEYLDRYRRALRRY